MHTAQLFYDCLDEQVIAQIVRDLLVMGGEWEVGVDLRNLPDADQNTLKPFLAELGIAPSFGKPELYLVYKTGDEYPQHPIDCPVVERDLNPTGSDLRLDTEARIGYYLKPQGRDGANLTERYLNRSYPKGRGYVPQELRFLMGP